MKPSAMVYAKMKRGALTLKMQVVKFNRRIFYNSKKKFFYTFLVMFCQHLMSAKLLILKTAISNADYFYQIRNLLNLLCQQIYYRFKKIIRVIVYHVSAALSEH